MKMRRMFVAVAMALGVKPRPRTRRGPAEDALGRMAEDALLLIARIYSGKSWSRRAMRGKMSQPRWGAAYRLLVEARVLDATGALQVGDWERAEVLVRDRVAAWRRLQAAGGRYTPPVG